MDGISTASPLLTHAWLALLPPAVARAVGLAQAPAALRGLFARTPARVRVDVAVRVDAGGLPPAAAPLLKLMAQSGAWAPGEVRREARGEIAITCRSGDAEVVLEGEELEAPLDAIVQGLFARLWDGVEIARIADGFARGAARLGALQILSQHLLEAADADEALQVLVAGITAADGLGLARAAVFVYDEIRRRFVGARALGPADADEAAVLAREPPRALEAILSGDAAPLESSYHSQIFGLEIVAGDDDEVAAVLRERRPRICPTPPVNPGLARLAGEGPLVVAALQPRERPIALIVADNRFAGGAIDDDQVAAFATLVGQAALVLDNLALLRHVERLARDDSLTGALSRREFEARMKIEEARSLRTKRPCALLMVDLDHFKAVNESRGHAGGDALLRQLGELLRQSLRAPDLIGRFGGDEFVLLLPEVGQDDALAIAARIGKLAWEHEIALSIGGATYPADAAVPAGLFSIADRNLYAAKEAGRGRACVGGERRMITLGG